LNEIFLAVKFKIRFKVRFARNYGSDQNYRFLRIIRRAMTYKGLLKYNTGLENKSKFIITDFISNVQRINVFKDCLITYRDWVVYVQRRFKFYRFGIMLRQIFMHKVITRELDHLIEAYNNPNMFRSKTEEHL